MKLTIAKSAGFCFGVNRAVNILDEIAEKEKNIVTLGPIIHNPNVVKHFEDLGVHCAENLEEIKNNSTVVIRTHGVEKKIIEEITSKNCKVIDVTCPFVKKIHNYVENYSKRGYNIIVIGDEHHPEVEGILGWCSDAFVINDIKDVDLLTISESDICVVSQTTFEKAKWFDITKELKNKFPSAVILNTICSATEDRQKDIFDISKNVDAVVVIGGRNSSNTKRLFDVAKKGCKNVFFVESAKEINKKDFYCYNTVGITAGASTPAYMIKEVADMLEEKELNFAEALEGTLKPLNTGDVVKGTIIKVTRTEAYVDLGTKYEGTIPADQASLQEDPDLNTIFTVGQEVEAFVVRVNDKDGYVTLSLRKLQSIEAQKELDEAFENGTRLEGTVTNVVNGGIIVFALGTKIFVPASLTGSPKGSTLDSMLKQKVTLKLIDMDRRRHKVVGSIRAVINEERQAKREAFWSTVEVGKEIKGVVKSVTSFGAFVDIGGVDGLVHISELSWDSFKKPSELVKPGDIIDVKILEFDKESGKISLGHKKAEDNPWLKIQESYKVDDVIDCKIVRLLPFGAFAEVIPGVDGLIHISQIADKKIGKPADVLSVGEVVKAKITDINFETQKIALSIRALLEPVVEEANEVKEETVENTEEVKAEPEETTVEEIPVEENKTEETNLD